ncbi:MAG: DUF3822 family protein [Bacteroidales bacterium]
MSGIFVPVVNKYDESLTEDLTGACSLSIQFSFESICFSIFYSPLNKYLAIESVDFGKFLSPESSIGTFSTYIRNHPWLRLPYSEIRIFYEAVKTTLVPSPLFLEDHKENFAQFNFASDINHQVLSDKIRNLDAYIVYEVHKAFSDLWADFFPAHTLNCHAGRLIDLVMLMNKNSPFQKRVFINVRKSYVDIAVHEGNKLLFFNSFAFRTREDFIYYVIFVMEQLAIHPEETEWMLSGFIDRDTPMFDILYKYVKNIRFLSGSDAFKYSYHFDEIPEHYFFNLINSRLCE